MRRVIFHAILISLVVVFFFGITAIFSPLPTYAAQCVSSGQCIGTGQGNCCDNMTCDGYVSGRYGKPGTCKSIANVCKKTTEACTGTGQGDCCSGLTCENYVSGRYGHSGTCSTVVACVTETQDCGGSNPGCCAGLTCQSGKCVATPSIPLPPSPPCKQWAANGSGCEIFATGLGDLAPKPAAFVQNLFGILLSFSGGIALLLIIRAGYRLMTSQGKPEQIQQGRDELIAAIVGLVFLIFSLVFLQLIGFDILRIPGFGAAQTGSIGKGGSCDVNNDQCAGGYNCVSLGTGNGRSGTCQ